MSHSNHHHRGPHHLPHVTNTDAARTDAVKLNGALLKKWFTDDEGVFGILCKRTSAQVQDIRQEYYNELKRDLLLDVKENTHGHFEDLVKALVMTPAEYDAYRIHRAMEDGFSTDEDQLIEIIAHRTNEEVRAYNESYLRQFGKTALQAIQGKESGDTAMLFAILANPELTHEPPMNEASQIEVDVKALYDASQNKMVGHDNKPFIQILAGSNREYVRKLYNAYANKHGKTLEEIISGWTFHTVVERTLLAIVTPPEEYYAKLLYKAMKGVGSNDNQLIRIIVTQRERHLPAIADHFMHEYKKALKEFIRDETSGDFKHALVALLEFYAEAKV